MAKYKQKCSRCKEQYVIVSSWKDRYPVCYDCQKNELQGEVTDPEMIKMFDIPHSYYVESPFLRNIKISYLRFGKLSEKQVDRFVKTVGEYKEAAEAASESDANSDAKTE